MTGGSAGIGYGIVAHLLQHNPAKIYLLSNKEDHADEAQEALKEWGDTSKVEWRKCNLEDLKQVDEVAKSLAKELGRLDALICNAGLGVGVYNETRDGLDSHMQVNVFSQAHLTLVLLPILQKTPDSRIVHQSSELHRGSDSSMKFESIQEINQDIGATKLYNRTKLAQILFLHQLYSLIKAGKYGQVTDSTGLPWINATHPGGVSTDQQNQAVEAYGTAGKAGVKAVRPFMKDPVSEGCRPALFAATSPDIVKNQIQVSHYPMIASRWSSIVRNIHESRDKTMLDIISYSGIDADFARTRTLFPTRSRKSHPSRRKTKICSVTCGS